MAMNQSATTQVYPRPVRTQKPQPDRRWALLAYAPGFDGLTPLWERRYRSRLLAHIAAWWHHKVIARGAGRIFLIDRGPGCRIDEDWCGAFIGMRSCSTHEVRWDGGGPCPQRRGMTEQSE